MDERTPRRRFDWLAWIGVMLAALGVLQVVSGASAGAAVLIVGALLFCASVIREAIEKNRR